MSLDVVIFASGEGSNAEALMDFAAAEKKLVCVLALISDRFESPALEKARQRKIPALHIPHKNEMDLLACLQELKPDWACLAGYMRIIGKPILDFFFDTKLGHSRILNIHPSALPDFPGLRAYEQAFQAGVSESGVTVHLVDAGLDSGPIVAQEKFLRKPGDTLEAFIARGRALEHKLYTSALRSVATGEFMLKPQAKKERVE